MVNEYSVNESDKDCDESYVQPDASGPFIPLSMIREGEKVRVMLSKLMLLKSNVLLLDDPTNHLDLESISSINEGLTNYKGSLLFASHDHEFIQTIANHIVVLSKNGVIDRIDETYDAFLDNAEVQAKVKALWAD